MVAGCTVVTKTIEVAGTHVSYTGHAVKHYAAIAALTSLERHHDAWLRLLPDMYVQASTAHYILRLISDESSLVQLGCHQ